MEFVFFPRISWSCKGKTDALYCTEDMLVLQCIQEQLFVFPVYAEKSAGWKKKADGRIVTCGGLEALCICETGRYSMNRAFLQTLLETASVSGMEEANQRHVIDYAKTFADEIRTDTVGNVISILSPQSETRILLCGHIDEIGFRVTEIDEKGMIHVQSAGGVNPKLYVGSPMQILHESVENGQETVRKICAVCSVDRELLKKESVKDCELTLDMGARDRKDAEQYVSVGDAVCADADMRLLLSERFTGRALDDKTGAAVVLEATRLAKEDRVTQGVYAATTVGEETTGRGAYFAACDVHPDCAVIVDVTWASDCPGADGAKTGEIRVGGGPVLCRSGMVNKHLNRMLEEIAREKQIPLQYEVAGAETCTDGDTVALAAMGIPIVLISIPLRYMHSSVEVASFTDLDYCVELLRTFLGRYHRDMDLRPVHA